MHRSIRALATTLTATAALVGAAGASTAATTPRPAPRPAAAKAKATTAGFATVRTTGHEAQALTSPVAGTVVVTGIRRAAGAATTAEGAIVVETGVAGRWTSQTLAATASRVQVTSTHGTTWILGTGAAPTLWRSTATGFVKVAQPPMPAGVVGWTPLALGSGDGSVVLWGRSNESGHPSSGTIARLTGSTWSVGHLYYPLGQPFYGPASTAFVTLTGDHVVADTMIGTGRPANQLIDFTTTEPTVLGLSMQVPPAGPAWGADDFVVRNATSATAWGFAGGFTGPDLQTMTDKGGCWTLAAGQRTACPAPAWRVTTATSLADGRQVIGGADTWSRKDVATGRTSDLVQGGYATVSTPGATPVTVAGDPGERTVDLAAEPTGTTVWSLSRTGAVTHVQRATLPAAARARIVPTRPARLTPGR